MDPRPASLAPTDRARTAAFALALLACAAAGPPAAAAPSRPPAAQIDEPAALDRLRLYLDRNPFHGRSLDDLAAAVGLAALTEDYAARAAAEPLARAPRIVLARLAARSQQLERAKGLLAELAGSSQSPREALELGRLGAALDLDAGAAQAAVAALTDLAARARSVDVELCEALLEELAEAAEVAGDAAALERALTELGAVLGADPAGLIALGRRCAEYDLLDRAEDALRGAVQASGDDYPRRCSALAALGAVLEQRQSGEAALSAYDEALGLLAAGHWLRKDLLERIVDLRSGAGTLDAWFSERRAAPGADSDAIELDQVAALQRVGRSDEAVERLVALAARRPNDRALADQVVELARAAGRMERVVPLLEARLQHAEASGPSATARAALDLADALAAAELAAGAHRALDRAEQTAEGADDLGLLLTVAHRRAALGDRARARATLERAAELAPTDTQALLELALHAERDGDPSAQRSALNRAEQRARGEDRIAVADAWRRAGEHDAAEAALVAALADPAARAAALAALVDQHTEAAAATTSPSEAEAERRRARTLAATWASEARGVARDGALDALLATFAARAERLALAEALAQEASEPGGPYAELRAALGPVALALLEARVATGLERHSAAAAAFARASAAEPDDLALRRAHIRALGRAGDTTAALAAIEALLSRAPEQRSELLLERARLEVEQRQFSAARATLAEVSALARRSAETLREVAGRLHLIGDAAGAVLALQRCLRLEPGDLRTARLLAQFERELGRNADAVRRLMSIWSAKTDAAERVSILRDLEQTLGVGELRDRFLAELVERVQRNVYDRAALELALALLPRARRFDAIETLAERLLERAPEDARGLAARSIARTAQGRQAEALADVGTRLARKEAPLAVFASLGDAQRAGNDEALCSELGALAARHLDDDQLAQAAREIDRPGYEGLTVAFLRGALPADQPLGDNCLTLLDTLHNHLGPPDFALRVLTSLEARDGATVVRAHRIGKLCHALGDRAGCLARGRQLLELGAPRRMVEGFYTSAGLGAEWLEDGAER